MRTLSKLALCGLVLVQSSAIACSIARSSYRFEPQPDEFERKHSFPIALTVPAPIVKLACCRALKTDQKLRVLRAEN